MKCPHCGSDPLEVRGVVVKGISGTFDDEGNLTTETDDEEITSIECVECGKLLPLSLIKNWS